MRARGNLYVSASLVWTHATEFSFVCLCCGSGPHTPTASALVMSLLPSPPLSCFNQSPHFLSGSSWAPLHTASFHLLKGSQMAAPQAKLCKPVTEASPWSAPTHISTHILHPCLRPSATGATPKLLGSPKHVSIYTWGCFYYFLPEDYSSPLSPTHSNPGLLLWRKDTS